MLGPFTRAETIRVLNSLGVDVPADTKLLDDILKKCLNDALDAAQYKDRLPEGMDINSLTPWPLIEHGVSAVNARPLSEAIARHNLDEAYKLDAKIRAGESIAATPFADPFQDLRETMAGLGQLLDRGLRWVLLQDEKHESAILFRVRLTRRICSSSS